MGRSVDTLSTQNMISQLKRSVVALNSMKYALKYDFKLDNITTVHLEWDFFVGDLNILFGQTQPPEQLKTRFRGL